MGLSIAADHGRRQLTLFSPFALNASCRLKTLGRPPLRDTMGQRGARRERQQVAALWGCRDEWHGWRELGDDGDDALMHRGDADLERLRRGAFLGDGAELDGRIDVSSADISLGSGASSLMPPSDQAQNAAVRRCLGFGEDIYQPIIQIRIRYTELDAIRRLHDAATSKRCAIAFNPKMRTIW